MAAASAAAASAGAKERFSAREPASVVFTRAAAFTQVIECTETFTGTIASTAVTTPVSSTLIVRCRIPQARHTAAIEGKLTRAGDGPMLFGVSTCRCRALFNLRRGPSEIGRLKQRANSLPLSTI